MWLFEGSQKALLVDTAQNTADKPIVPGQLDLVTVVKQLLGHDNTGAVKPDPVDFEVAITHNHGDHTGKAVALAPRTVYFPDGDWPANAPAHYVPIREGGGVTARGTMAVAKVELGDRTLEAVNIRAVTPSARSATSTARTKCWRPATRTARPTSTATAASRPRRGSR